MDNTNGQVFGGAAVTPPGQDDGVKSPSGGPVFPGSGLDSNPADGAPVSTAGLQNSSEAISFGAANRPTPGAYDGSRFTGSGGGLPGVGAGANPGTDSGAASIGSGPSTFPSSEPANSGSVAFNNGGTVSGGPDPQRLRLVGQADPTNSGSGDGGGTMTPGDTPTGAPPIAGAPTDPTAQAPDTNSNIIRSPSPSFSPADSGGGLEPADGSNESFPHPLGGGPQQMPPTTFPPTGSGGGNDGGGNMFPGGNPGGPPVAGGDSGNSAGLESTNTGTGSQDQWANDGRRHPMPIERPPTGTGGGVLPSVDPPDMQHPGDSQFPGSQGSRSSSGAESPGSGLPTMPGGFNAPQGATSEHEFGGGGSSGRGIPTTGAPNVGEHVVGASIASPNNAMMSSLEFTPNGGIKSGQTPAEAMGITSGRVTSAGTGFEFGGASGEGQAGGFPGSSTAAPNENSIFGGGVHNG